MICAAVCVEGSPAAANTMYCFPLNKYGIAERWIGSCRRELLDHVIVLNDAHLRRIRDYISYYHADRIHDSLEKDTPAMRPVSSKPGPAARLVSLPRIGGLYHRYDWQQAA